MNVRRSRRRRKFDCGVLCKSVGATRIAFGVLAVVALSTGGLEQPAFGVFVALVTAVGSGSFERTRERASLLAYGVGGWSLFALLPFLTTGEQLRGPYGGPPWLFATGVMCAAWRVWALGKA